MTTALLLIDIQNDYFPGGKMALEGSIEASLRAGEILAFCRRNSLPRIHIQHVATRPGATFFLPNTEGMKIHKNVAPQAGEVIFQKSYPNSFRNTPLLQHLRETQVEKIIITGMMTHMCVDATARAAFDLGFQVIVAHDACATRSLAFQEQIIPAAHVQAAFLASLNATYAQVISTAELLQKWEP